MKRILHIIESIQVGGAENLLCNTIAELPEYEHLVVTVYADNNLAMLPFNALHRSLGARSRAEVLLKLSAYRKVLRDFQPDMVHAHLYFATILAKVGTPSRIPVLFTVHSEFSKNFRKWYYHLTDRFVSSSKQTCVAVSNVVLQDYVRTTGFRGKKHVLGIYIPDRYFSLEKHAGDMQDKKELRIVALGNVKPIKNHRFLLDAFAHLKDLPVSCDVYGEGVERVQLEKEAKQKGIPVFFKGPITDSARVLPLYDLYIMPSFSEGFPLALFESMAASLPVIVSDIPVFHELLQDQGDFVSLAHPAQVRERVLKYWQQKNLLYSKGEALKKLAFEKASRQNYLQQLRAIYNQLISPSAGNSWHSEAQQKLPLIK